MQTALDSVCFTTVTVLVTTLVISHTGLLSVKEQAGLIYLPIFFISVISTIICGISFISLADNNEEVNLEDSSTEKKDNTKSFIANKIKVQMILAFSLAFIFSIGCVYIFFPAEKINIGEGGNDKSIFYLKDIERGSLIWCFVLGIISQIIQISIIEYFTSHRFSHFVETAESINQDISLGIVGLNKTSHLSFTNLISVLGFVFVLCFMMAGILGLAFCALGIASTSIILLSCSLYGSLSTQAETIVHHFEAFNLQLIRKVMEI